MQPLRDTEKERMSDAYKGVPENAELRNKEVFVMQTLLCNNHAFPESRLIELKCIEQPATEPEKCLECGWLSHPDILP